MSTSLPLQTPPDTCTIAEFLEGLGLEATLENRKRAYGLVQTYAQQTGVVFDHQPQNYQLLIPLDVRDVLAQTWALSAEVGLPPARLLALWLHHRQAMLAYFTGTQPGLAAPQSSSAEPHPILLDISATLHRLRRELLYPEIPLD
ncbi:hypothetical protein ACINK0_17725 (plasmid) [Deinococcus sp. VB343]|uniref:Uncharacterized protein n=2 Tax=Deinococcus TaxID=1298 RepID=A0A345ILT3_9DEIO|nr:hypothetical protein [Deinococcus wulumuqiensis]AXH00656.1 hypothetical protein DVJ83_15990 [Deinococcus wulumuqiensis]